VKQAFEEHRFSAKTQKALEQAQAIINDYHSKGYVLTLRQLYYQHVARGFTPNNQREYNKLAVLIRDARMAGLVDWDDIQDLTRGASLRSTFASPEDLHEAALASYRLDRWEGQELRVELWSEKEALSSVLAPIADKHHVPLVMCRGYPSVSMLYEASQRLRGKPSVILYLGDHDPSGMDIPRALERTLGLMGSSFVLERIGLTMEQVRQYGLPPNPVKEADKRQTGYSEKYGGSCWEVDALRPDVLTSLVEENVLRFIDQDKLLEVLQREERDKQVIEGWLK